MIRFLYWRLRAFARGAPIQCKAAKELDRRSWITTFCVRHKGHLGSHRANCGQTWRD